MSKYKPIYPNAYLSEVEPSGGYVEVELNYNVTREAANVETAIILAKHGHKVRLLIASDLPGVRTPDAFLVDENVRVEFKVNLRPTRSAIDNELRTAKTQASCIVLHIKSNLPKGYLIDALTSRLRRTIGIRKVWLIWKGNLRCHSRKEILGKGFGQKIE